MKTEHSWGWPIAGYLFLGGLGGGSIVVSSVADLFFGKGEIFALGSLMTAVLIGLGSALLIFELGRPLQFWRVFSTQKAIMTVGAWMLSLLIVTSFLYFTFWPEFIPWRQWVLIRQLLAAFNLLLGLGVCTYTGILLGSLKARRFWNTPMLPILFLVSGLSTGVAMQSLLAGVWPYAGSLGLVEQIHPALRALDVGLICLELIIVAVYVLMMRSSADEDAARAANSWLTGSKKVPFLAGLLGVGLILPILAYALGGNMGFVIAPICALIGGIFLRFLVVFSDVRTELPGEAEYYANLPGGDETFLKAWK